jgi:hypothetical protein
MNSWLKSIFKFFVYFHNICRFSQLQYISVILYSNNLRDLSKSLPLIYFNDDDDDDDDDDDTNNNNNLSYNIFITYAYLNFDEHLY